MTNNKDKTEEENEEDFLLDQEDEEMDDSKGHPGKTAELIFELQNKLKDSLAKVARDNPTSRSPNPSKFENKR